MNKSIRPDDTRDTRPAATPLTDSWQASVQKGATPGIFPIMWRDGFAVGHGTVQNFTRDLSNLRVVRHRHGKPLVPLEHDGQKLFWVVEGMDYAEDGKTVLKNWLKIEGWFETKEQADAGLPKCLAWVKAETDKTIAALEAAAAHKPTSDEQDLTQARLKVMREQHPDTFKAMDALAKARPEDRPAAMEALFRAYAVDKVRLHKPANLGDILPFKSTLDDMSFFFEIVKAHNAQSPRDPVDMEIAARWFAAGYDKMSLAEYTDAINAKTGAKLKPDAMEKRRYAKLGLMTKKPPGPPPKF
jgi:hypothetical protein